MEFSNVVLTKPNASVSVLSAKVVHDDTEYDISVHDVYDYQWNVKREVYLQRAQVIAIAPMDWQTSLMSLFDGDTMADIFDTLVKCINSATEDGVYHADV